MGTLVTKENLMKAGVATVAALLAMNVTAGKSKLVQGGAMFAAVLVSIPLAAKL